MICYGIGCIHDSRVSQYQYACALRLQSALHIPNVMEIFDPSMDVVGFIVLFSNRWMSKSCNTLTRVFCVSMKRESARYRLRHCFLCLIADSACISAHIICH